jgi:hypothetical protein
MEFYTVECCKFDFMIYTGIAVVPLKNKAINLFLDNGWQ